MSDLKRNISQALNKQKPHVAPSMDVINSFISRGVPQQKQPPIIRSANTRPKNPSVSPLNFNSRELSTWTELQKEIQNFTKNAKNIYLTFGGVGDCLLGLSSCWNQEDSHIIFNANEGSKDFAKNFFDYFKVKSMIIRNTMGTSNANKIVAELQRNPNFRTSAHLADNLDFGDWERNFAKYKQRIKTNPGWENIIGTDPQFSLNKTVVICPSGSAKIKQRKRYFEKNELFLVTDHFIKNGWQVVITSSEADLKYYGLHHFDNVYWMTSNKLIQRTGKVTPITFDRFLKIINSCQEVISAETWLKTFTLLLNKKTKVLKVRMENDYQDFGIISADFIFINPNLWSNLQLVTMQDILSI
jgi:hypothetical protein